MTKILIANRGEIACRIIRSCRALGIRTVAVYSDADTHSKHVEEADESFHIGGSAPVDSYLKRDALLDVARKSGAIGVHPGYGFLAEDDKFADAVERAGLVWVGPSPKSILDMGDKQRARLLAVKAGVAVLPGSPLIDFDDEALLMSAAASVGFPLLVKASAGGGGIGMRRVDDKKDLASAVKTTRHMAEKSFGDGSVYLEKYISRARHIEVQVFGFGNGEAIHLFERDCSTQRRYQKIIEESPAPRLPQHIKDKLFHAAVSLCKQEKYRGAGTVEFVLDAETGEFFFLEMNTRIQVEHPVSEMNSGIDLVGLQIRLALGLPISERRQDDVKQVGHSFECRIYAERPARNFLPSTGRLTTLRFPLPSASVRIDSGVREGDTITPFYDPMVAKIIVHAANRASAISLMKLSLEATVIEGVETNMAFLLRVLSHPLFADGDLTTNFVEQQRQYLLA